MLEGLPLARAGSEIGSIATAIGIQHSALIAALEQRFEFAATLIGYSNAFFAAEFGAHNPVERQISSRLMKILTNALAPNVLVRSLALGAGMTEDQALAEALEA